MFCNVFGVKIVSYPAKYKTIRVHLSVLLTPTQIFDTNILSDFHVIHLFRQMSKKWQKGWMKMQIHSLKVGGAYSKAEIQRLPRYTKWFRANFHFCHCRREENKYSHFLIAVQIFVFTMLIKQHQIQEYKNYLSLSKIVCLWVVVLYNSSSSGYKTHQCIWNYL